MRWLADECVHSDVVRDLRVSGHDVIYAAEVFRRTPDADIADEALRDGRILLTEDKDFGDIAFQQLRAVPAIVLLRFPQERRQLKSVRLLQVIARYGITLSGNFTVVEETRERQRPVPNQG
jgi:predicted nuclease of predicted toxin-antitoxin system